MKPVLVDSSVWINFFNGRAGTKTERLLSLLGARELAVGDLILMEVLQGFRHDADVRRAERALAALPCHPLGGEHRAREAAMNHRRLRASGVTPRASIDVLIATFCVETGHALLHDDRGFDAMATPLGLDCA